MTYQIKKIREVCELQNGFAFKSAEYVNSGCFVMRITNVQDGFIELNNPKYVKDCEQNFKKFTLNEGNILISLTGNVGRVGIIQKEHLPAVLNQRVARIKVIDTDRMDSKYLFLFLKSPYFIKEVIEMGHGMAQKNVSTRDIENLQIPVPPIEEQRKIVKKIEESFAKIDEAQKLREETQKDSAALLPAALHHIFSQGKEKGWEMRRIGDEKILKMTSGGTPSRSNANYYGGDIFWLKSGELNDNQYILTAEETITVEALKNSSAKIFPRNTVLFAMYGATAGKLGILNVQASTNQAVAGLICNESILNYRYLFYCLLYIREKIVARAWGGAQPNLSQTIIKNFKIPLPPLAEQIKIVKYLDSLSEKVSALQKLQTETTNDFSALKQSILHKAFSGELLTEGERVETLTAK